MNGYTLMPAADLNGSAGDLGPGEREARYRPYAEKQYMNATAADIAPAVSMPGGCHGTDE